MASLFDRMFRQSAVPVHQQYHGEAVVYRFRDGSTENFVGPIDRQPIQILGLKGEVWQPRFVITIPVETKLVNTGGDRVDVFEHPTDTVAKTYSVLQILSQNGLTTELALG